MDTSNDQNTVILKWLDTDGKLKYTEVKYNGSKLTVKSNQAYDIKATSIGNQNFIQFSEHLQFLALTHQRTITIYDTIHGTVVWEKKFSSTQNIQ